MYNILYTDKNKINHNFFTLAKNAIEAKILFARVIGNNKIIKIVEILNENNNYK